ncbi:MAG: hypothetical protein ABTQ25_19280 [Nitrosomonas ureae]
MIKKLLFGIGFIVLTKILVFIFIEDKQKPALSQNEVDKIVQETQRMTPGELENKLKESSRANPKMSQSELESLASGLNKIYPKTLQSGVRIDRVTTGIELLTYHKTYLNYTVDELDLSAITRNVLLEDLCTNSGASRFLKSGISIQNIQLDKNGALIHDFTAHPKDCT